MSSVRTSIKSRILAGAFVASALLAGSTLFGGFQADAGHGLRFTAGHGLSLSAGHGLLTTKGHGLSVSATGHGL